MTEKTGYAAHLDAQAQKNAQRDTSEANVEATVKAELRYYGKVIDGDWSHIPAPEKTVARAEGYEAKLAARKGPAEQAAAPEKGL